MLVTFDRFPMLFSDVQPSNVFLLIAVSFSSPPMCSKALHL